MILHRLERPDGLGPFGHNKEENERHYKVAARHQGEDPWSYSDYFWNFRAPCQHKPGTALHTLHPKIKKGSPWHFACQSEADLQAWFGKLSVGLRRLGFQLSTYSIRPEYTISGDRQVCFLRPMATLESRRDIPEDWKELPSSPLTPAPIYATLPF